MYKSLQVQAQTSLQYFSAARKLPPYKIIDSGKGQKCTENGKKILLDHLHNIWPKSRTSRYSDFLIRFCLTWQNFVTQKLIRSGIILTQLSVKPQENFIDSRKESLFTCIVIYPGVHLAQAIAIVSENLRSAFVSRPYKNYFITVFESKLLESGSSFPHQYVCCSLKKKHLKVHCSLLRTYDVTFIIFVNFTEEIGEVLPEQFQLIFFTGS